MDTDKFNLVINPVGDGNYGFRCIAFAVNKNQNKWELAKIR
jgi:hypothetical protein